MLALSESQLRDWLDAYGRAWESQDPDAAAPLFTEDTEYFETPFVEPARGRKGVHAYWTATTGNHEGVKFTYEIKAVTGNIGIARWSSRFTRVSTGAAVHLDGVFVLEFGEDGLCSRLREWWHCSEGGQPDG